MRPLALTLGLVLVAAACKRTDEHKPTPEARIVDDRGCQRAATALAHVSTDQAGDPETVAMLFAVVEPAIRLRCIADDWPATATTCYATVKTTADLGRCHGTLTDAQDSALNRDMVAAMKTVANVVNQ